MLAALLLAAFQQPALAGAGVPSGYEPQPCDAARLREAFPDSWKLPRADRRGVALPSARFEEAAIRLAAEPLAPGADGGAPLMLGDLLARIAEIAREPDLKQARRRVEALLADARARVPAALWPRVEQLLDVRDFLSPKWDPDDGDEHDGFLMGEHWDLPEDCWPRHEGDRTVVQCAVLVAADLACIKLAEHDFPNYLRYPESNYERVAGVAHSYFYEPIPDREPAAGLACARRMALSMDMESDLPFPFSGYALRLRVLTDLDEEGRPITWVYSDSDDFHWMAGYDRYVPVRGASGALVGTLILRQTGLDLDGVPDRASQREGGMRSVLGGVRRRAEALWRERAAGGPFPGTGAVPVAPMAAGG